MEVIKEGRNFRLVSDSELPEILNTLEKMLPESLKVHQTLKLYLNNRVWNFHFYVSKDWPEKPILIQFPGCTLTPDNNIYQSFSVFCPLTHLECVSQVTSEDYLMDWNKPMYLHFTHVDIVERLARSYNKIGTNICDILTLNDAQSANLTVEEFEDNEAEIRPLTKGDLKIIHDLYPGNDIESIELFEILVNKLPALGVFIKNTNELAAWMMTSYYGAMFSMQTLPKFRGKGYGTRIAKALTRQVIDSGYIAYVAVRPDNPASQNLYKKLGFQKPYQMIRAMLVPKTI